MRNTYKYTKMYSGAEPEFIEGDIFRIIIPLSEVATATVGPEGTVLHDVPHDVLHDVPHDVPHKDSINQLYKMIQENPYITRKEIGERLGMSARTVGRKIKALNDIKYVGSGNNGHWEITEDSQQKP